ncbi:tyrosine-type recombinase/integrase [Bacillus sp. NPDC094106]|uniref:tyrosine-type recombinase/integrase n=1 Tax=Bacillus sp. NPDC094106 TaxID=3363949 RepID=UPI00382C4566
MKYIQQVETEQLGFHERLQHELSSYLEKKMKHDGSVTIKRVKNIDQFQETVENYTNKNRNLHFQINSPTVNLEIKYVWYHKLFNESWTLNSAFSSYVTNLRKISEFLNELYPSLFSLLDLDLEKTEREWMFWLEKQGITTRKIIRNVKYDKYTHKSGIAIFFRTVYSNLFTLTDTREEWEKDRWDVRILHEKYGISYNKSRSHFYLNFTNIPGMKMRKEIKRYFKQCLLSKNHFSWGTAANYLRVLPQFLSFLFSLEPTWDDLKRLKRSYIERYIQWLHEYSKNKVTQKNAHPEHYVMISLTRLGKFLEDIQRYEYDIAPETPVRLLIFPEDKPKLRKKSIDQIDYIPDYVLEQLFTHLNDLHSDVIPVIWIAFKTGLRISDVLGLTKDCLLQLNGKYSIVTDIEKTYVQGHRIPIDEELAKIIAVLISQSKARSTQDNNPEGYIFTRYKGPRKGMPYSQSWVRDQLRVLAYKKHIVDENGDIFHFTPHQFRHTYAVKLLNGGADILTVQELLAHASPEMTLRYAKLLDDTKRKAFESVINQGVFSFDLNGEVQDIQIGEDIPEDILQALWQDHKLNAMDNPYGTCHARLKGNCPHMEAPPCLTCNGGSPCKDLAIGFSEYDVQKYELHVKTTLKAIEVAKQRGREDMAVKQERNLHRYEGILHNIREGNVIFGRQERMNRKRGIHN